MNSVYQKNFAAEYSYLQTRMFETLSNVLVFQPSFNLP